MKKRLKKAVGIVLFLTLLTGICGGIGSTSLAASFPDVGPEAWYYDTVNWASDAGLITGYEDGTFGPDDILERGQFITILYRMAVPEDERAQWEQNFEDGIYTDVENGWFYSIPVTWAHSTGVMTGYEDGSFGPTDKVTREQVATILYRYAKNMTSSDTSANGEPDAWPDGGSVSPFAREGVQYALGAGLIRGDQGYIHPTGFANRAQTATILQRFVSYTEREEASNISNTNSQYTIEADVRLTGSGTGYHAKLVACTPTSAVSFGIQYDQWGEPPYTDKTTFLIENVRSNDQGGQEYIRTGYAFRDNTYHLMLTVQEDGAFDVYVNGVCVGSGINTELAGQELALRVEGSGRKDGDSVHAEFSNISLKGKGVYQSDKTWGTHNFDSNPGIHSDDSRFSSDKAIVIDGSITGLSDEQDWDNAYGIVSGTIQFVG